MAAGTQKELRFPHQYLRDFMAAVFQRLEVMPADAQIAAEALIEADLMGIDSHGIAQLATRSILYIDALQKGISNPRARPTVVTESPSLAVIDGQGAMGQVAAHMAQQLAMSKAQETGVGVVTVRNSHHFGAAGVWALRAANAGMIGIVTQHGGRLVIAAGGRERAFGSNPIAVAIPSDPYPFLMDFATSAVSLGKLQIAEMQGRSIPEGWAVDADGQATTDPRIFQFGGALVPLGSSPEMSWHKGHALAMLIEILGAVLSGGTTGLDSDFRALDHCHFHLALRIDGFRPLPEFVAHLAGYQDRLRHTKPIDPARPVASPGDFEFAARAERLQRGVPLHPTVVEGLQRLAAEYQVPFPSPV